jgi:hypothetical protein
MQHVLALTKQPLNQDPEVMHTPADEKVADIESPEHTEGTPAEDDTDASVVDVDISGDADARRPQPLASRPGCFKASRK